MPLLLVQVVVPLAEPFSEMLIIPLEPAVPPLQFPEMARLLPLVTCVGFCVIVIVGPDVLLVHEPATELGFPARSVSENV